MVEVAGSLSVVRKILILQSEQAFRMSPFEKAKMAFLPISRHRRLADILSDFAYRQFAAHIKTSMNQTERPADVES